MRPWLILLALCGTALAGNPLDVHVRMRAKHDRMTMDVAPDDTLHTTDYVELLVTTNAKAYVYVVQIFPDGTSTVLFPDDGDLVLDANKDTRVPSASDEWFQLDDVTGTETVYVIASRQPLAKADQALAKELHDIRAASNVSDPSKTSGTGAGKPKPAPPRPERMLAVGRRNLHKVVKKDNATTLVVSSKDDGFVVATFAFKHAH